MKRYYCTSSETLDELKEWGFKFKIVFDEFCDSLPDDYDPFEFAEIFVNANESDIIWESNGEFFLEYDSQIHQIMNFSSERELEERLQIILYEIREEIKNLQPFIDSILEDINKFY
jgi:hypothetical protein